MERIRAAGSQVVQEPVRPAEHSSRVRREARLRLYRALLLLIVSAGIGCRAVQYAWKTSLWHDEALVTLNLMHRDYRQLLRPLDYEQAAPPLFLWAEKAMLDRFGFGEYQLRLVSLICAVVSLVLFAWTAWRLFPAPVALWAAALFAFCDKLIWHSAEVKQYSSDVLAAMLLLFLAIGLRHPLWAAGRLMVLAIVAAVLAWFSFPAVFVFAALSLMLLPRILWQGHNAGGGRPVQRLPGGLLLYAAGNLLVLGSFALLYALCIRGHAAYLDRYWQEHLANWSKPWILPWWIVKEVYSLCDHPYRSFGWLVLPLAVIGAFDFYRRRKPNLVWACAGPVGFCLLAAMAGKYPFTGERITLFLVPGLFLLAAAGLEWARSTDAGRQWWFILPLPMVAYGIVLAGGHLAHPHARSSIRPVVDYVRAHRQGGEAICLIGEPTSPRARFVSGRNLELLCYWPEVPAPVYGRIKDLREVRENRLWLVYAALPEHGNRYMRSALDEARSIGTVLDDHEIPGGGAVLVEKR